MEMSKQENKGETSNRQASSSSIQNGAQVQLADLIDLCSSHYIYAEEKTVKERMIRPKPEFLEILKAAGAEWELFTWKEICDLLKDYINLHQLFDEADPRIVNCGKDPLGKVFGVSMFTLGNAMHYINANCYNLADSCEKRRMCLFAKPRKGKTITSGQRDRPRVFQVACPSLVDIEICETLDPGSSVDIAAPSTQLQMGAEDKMVESLIQGSLKDNSTSQVPSTQQKPVVEGRQQIPVVEGQLYQTSQNVGNTAQTHISLTPNNSQQGSQDSFQPLRQSSSESTGQPLWRQTSESTGQPRQRQTSESTRQQSRQTSESTGQQSRQTSESTGQQLRQTSEEMGKGLESLGHPPRQPSENLVHGPRQPSESLGHQPRQPSESLVHGPRQPSESLVHQPRQPSESLLHTPRQASESLGQPPKQTSECSGHPPRQPLGSIGHRPRRTSLNINYGEPGSSTGPLCLSLELTGGNTSQDEDVIAIDLEGDRFEYEVVSEDNEEIISSTASISGLSENDVMIICADSDVEFWADSSEAEFSEEDYWTCIDCNIKNPPLIGRCTKCSKLRPNWLPEKTRKRRFETSYDKDLLSSSECGEEFFVPRKKPHIESDSDQTVEDTLASSQESLIKATNEKWTTSASQIAPIENDMGIYRNLLNYQSDQPITSQVSNQQMYNRHMLAVNQNQPIRDKQLSSAAPKKERNDLEQFDERCIICLNKPKSASIVHGSSGHQVCCFRCAKRLHRQKKPCPICRRSIQKVIKNFIV